MRTERLTRSMAKPATNDLHCLVVSRNPAAHALASMLHSTHMQAAHSGALMGISMEQRAYHTPVCVCHSGCTRALQL